MVIVKKKLRKIPLFFYILSTFGILGFNTIGIIFILYSLEIPSLKSLTPYGYKPNTISYIYSDNNEVIGEFFTERRIIIPLEKIPEKVIQSFIAAEDANFYKHKGVDIISIGRAFIKNLKAKKIVQGGSTITQQLARSLLGREKTITRKIKEAILAYNIERNLSKNEILYLYLNQIYLGDGAYGVQAAAQNYFGKDIDKLDLAEIAMIAGITKAPTLYSPKVNFTKAKERQLYVLERMLENQFITKDEFEMAKEEKIQLVNKKNINEEKAPYFTEYVRRYIEKKYNIEEFYKGGWKVYTTLNLEYQKYAEEALDEGLREYDKRHGFRGKIDHIDKEKIEDYIEKLINENECPQPNREKICLGVVEEIDNKQDILKIRLRWGKGIIKFKDIGWVNKKSVNSLNIGDIIYVKIKDISDHFFTLSLEQNPEVQGAIISIEPYTRYIKAMVGGNRFAFPNDKFNRAVQALRQPGSAFKPIIYAAALDKGFTPASIVIDTAVVEEISSGSNSKLVWKPQNYNEKFEGSMTLREALAKSVNNVAVRIMQDIGASYLIRYAKNIGIYSDLDLYKGGLSISLGGSEVHLIELTNVYAVFASEGLFAEPISILKLVDRNGKVLENNIVQEEEIKYPYYRVITQDNFYNPTDYTQNSNARFKQVISRQTAYLMTNLLESVVNEGTGTRAKIVGRPAAGKTGTTNNFMDAWFIGYTKELVTGVWVGYDSNKTLESGEAGGKVAAPIWGNYMKQALQGEPIKKFDPPPHIVFVRIDKDSGLRASEYSSKTSYEPFLEGTEPQNYARSKYADPEKFFKFDVDRF